MVYTTKTIFSFNGVHHETTPWKEKMASHYNLENVRVRSDVTVPVPVPVSDVSIPGWSGPSEKIRIWPDLQFFITPSITVTLLQFDNLFISGLSSRMDDQDTPSYFRSFWVSGHPVFFFIKLYKLSTPHLLSSLYKAPGHDPALCHVMSPPGVCHKLGSDKTNWLNNAHWHDRASDWVILPLVATQLQTLASTIYEYLVPLSSIWIFFQTVHGL